MKKMTSIFFALFLFATIVSYAQPGTPCDASFQFTVNGQTGNVQFFPSNINTSATLQHYWNFGDGSYSTDIAAPSHTYSAGTYTAVHVVSYYSPNDSLLLLCRDTAIRTITIAGQAPCNIHAAFAFARDTLQSNKVYFTNHSTGTNPNTLYRWSFGDGSVSYDANPVHIFQASGLFNVCLSVMNDSLCSDDTCRQLQIQVPANTCAYQVYFSAMADSSNPLLWHFINQTQPANTTDSLIWLFGDGSSASQYNVSHVYNQAGTYNVCLIVRRTVPGAVPCLLQYCKTITVSQPVPSCNLHANYSFVRDSVQTNKVYFTNLSTGTNPNTTVKWIFGDGTVSFDHNPTHIFTTSGAFNVCLLVGNDSTCRDEHCSLVQVQVPTACNLQVNFEYVKDSLTAGPLPVYRFYNTTTPLGAADSSFWNFGDGSPIVINPNNPVSHSYTAPGVYTVCLLVKKVQPGTINIICQRQVCKTVIVTNDSVPFCTITPGFNWRADSLQRKRILFANTTTGATSNALATWSFGDGSSVTGWNAEHLYTQPGNYTVCLHVVQNNTCFSDTCGVIVVSDSTNPSVCTVQPYFESYRDSVLYNQVHFINLAGGFNSTDSLFWSFGDGSGSTDYAPVHTYNQGGMYNVCLTVKRTIPGAVPCVRQYCQTITVQQQACNFTPAYTYYTDSINGGSPLRYHFTNTTSPINTTDSLTWNFGDGSPLVKGVSAPVHTFPASGIYNVCLIVKRGVPGTVNFCVREYCDTVLVDTVPPPACNLSAGFNWYTDSLNTSIRHFINQSNGQPANTTATWSFGDGTSSADWNPVHHYTAPGQYQVCLRVAQSNTCVREICNTLVIVPPATDSCNMPVSFVHYADQINPNKIYFSAANTGISSTSAVTWSFGDGSAGAGINVNHTYAQPGRYIVCVTVTNSNLCTRTGCDSVEVNIIPGTINCDSIQLGYVFRRDNYMPNKVFFFATSNRPIMQQRWTFTNTNNGSIVTVNQPNPVYVFPDTGLYNVCVRANYWGGCVKEHCGNIRILNTGMRSQCRLYAYPNPATSNVSVNVQMQEQGPISISIFSLQNVLMRQDTRRGTVGNNLVTLDIRTLPPGFYSMRIVYGNNVCHARFQKF